MEDVEGAKLAGRRSSSGKLRNVQNSLGVDTSSTAMGARITSVLKNLEHRNACVGLAVNNLELSGNGKSELQATPIRSRFSG